MTNKIIDCFTFYNELNMLKFRLQYLYEIVDKFILVESTLTHSGENKELYYENNKELFKKYNDKIIHIIVNDLPDKNITENAWVREKMQRNCIDRGIKKLDIELKDNDLINICDIDEIPDKNTLSKLKNISQIDNNVYSFEQDMYYYNLNTIQKSKWYHPKIVNYYTYKNLFNNKSDDIRCYNIYKIIKKGGWHFSYFGDINFIKNKIKMFAHQEYNNDTYLNDEQLLKQIKNNDDIFLRGNLFEYNDIKTNKYLPDNYELLLELYKDN